MSVAAGPLPSAAGSPPDQADVARAAPTPRHIAIVDGGSFVLPYVHELAMALHRRGHLVTVFASHTRYNPEFLQALRTVPGIEVVAAAVSGSVATRWRGVPAYLGLLWTLWRRRAQFDTVDLQFPVLWLPELPLWRALGRRFVMTVHNAVPHGHAGQRHRPTEWTARMARALVFASAATRADFLCRYGDAWAARSTVVPHGLLPLAPGEPPRPPRVPATVRTLVYWSTVKPYKGVELMRELAQSPAVQDRGLALEVHGRWSPDLAALRAELVGLGVRVDDRYLGAEALRALFTRDDVVFLLPYRAASQSGALYTLLHQGACVLCTDTGDLGDVMRRHGLDGLLLDEASPAAVLAALDRLQARPEAWRHAYAKAQRASGWDDALAAGAGVYDAA